MSVKKDDTRPKWLEGKKGLIVGIANENSIAYGCGKILHQLGAELAITYLNEKAKPYAEPLARDLEAKIFMPLNVQQEGEMSALFERIKEEWGRLDFVIHSIAYCPKEDLAGRVVDCSLQGFLQAMQVSCYSFIELARFAEPLMNEGGSLITMSYAGSERVVSNYNIMGPVKAALEAVTRYMAVELGKKKIRVHTVSPGPLMTRAASGIAHFDELIASEKAHTAGDYLISIDDVGKTCAFLISDASRALTGGITYVDNGRHSIS